MEKEQTSLLLALARKLKRENPSNEAAIASLSSAGIITKKGKMTKAFPNLKRVLSVPEP